MNFYSYVSPYVITIVLAWIIAHLLKYIIDSIKSNNKKFNIVSHFFRSGGIPSAHTTMTLALATIVGLTDGFNTALFGIALLVTLVVTYDAFNIRRSVGEQGDAIKKLISNNKSNIKLPFVVKGHNLIDVICGALLGILIAYVVYITTL